MPVCVQGAAACVVGVKSWGALRVCSVRGDAAEDAEE